MLNGNDTCTKRPAHDPLVCGLDGPGISPTCPGCIAPAQATTDRARNAPAPHSVRSVLVAARRLFHALRVVERPPLDQPANACGLFTADEMVLLAKCTAWPLSPEAIAFIRKAPPSAPVGGGALTVASPPWCATVMVAELPAAIAFLQGSKSP